jgi:hypothetical protein
VKQGKISEHTSGKNKIPGKKHWQSHHKKNEQKLKTIISQVDSIVDYEINNESNDNSISRYNASIGRQKAFCSSVHCFAFSPEYKKNKSHETGPTVIPIRHQTLEPTKLMKQYSKQLDLWDTIS